MADLEKKHLELSKGLIKIRDEKTKETMELAQFTPEDAGEAFRSVLSKLNNKNKSSKQWNGSMEELLRELRGNKIEQNEN